MVGDELDGVIEFRLGARLGEGANIAVLKLTERCGWHAGDRGTCTKMNMTHLGKGNLHKLFPQRNTTRLQ